MWDKRSYDNYGRACEVCGCYIAYNKEYVVKVLGGVKYAYQALFYCQVHKPLYNTVNLDGKVARNMDGHNRMKWG